MGTAIGVSLGREDAELTAVIGGILAQAGLLGHVTLDGQVEHWSERDAIERAARGFRGVQRITNLVRICPELLERELQRVIQEAQSCPP